MPLLPFDNPLLIENGWRPPPPGFPNYMPPRRYEALCISTLVASRGTLGRRIWLLVASLALVSWLGSWTCSCRGACVRAVVLVCFHILVGACIRVCVGGQVCVRFCCVRGRIQGGCHEYGADGNSRKPGGLSIDMNLPGACEEKGRE